MRSRDSLFEAAFPGLLARLRALGGHELAPTLCLAPSFKCDRNDELVMVEVGARHEVPYGKGRTCVVQVALRAKLVHKTWEPQMVSYHCGPNAAAMDEVHFRIDSNALEGFHCHIFGQGPKPTKGGHIHVRRVEPRPSLDPFEFMKLVEAFVATGAVPLKVVRP